MNMLDILTISLYYFFPECVGVTDENSNFDLRLYRVNSNVVSNDLVPGWSPFTI